MPLGPMKTKAQKKAGVKTVMNEWKAGKLNSGSPTGPVVKSQKQAVAIALSETGQSKKQSKTKKATSITATPNTRAAAPPLRTPPRAPYTSTSMRFGSGKAGAHRIGRK